DLGPVHGAAPAAEGPAVAADGHAELAVRLLERAHEGGRFHGGGGGEDGGGGGGRSSTRGPSIPSSPPALSTLRPKAPARTGSGAACPTSRRAPRTRGGGAWGRFRG